MRNQNLDNCWEEIIYPIDQQRINQFPELSLFDFISQNKEILYKSFTSEEVIKISKYLNINDDKFKLNTKFQIVSIGGVNDTIKLIKEAIEFYKYDVKIKLDSVPNFNIESDSEEVTKENHLEILKMIKDNSVKLENKCFVKY